MLLESFNVNPIVLLDKYFFRLNFACLAYHTMHNCLEHTRKESLPHNSWSHPPYFLLCLEFKKRTEQLFQNDQSKKGRPSVQLGIPRSLSFSVQLSLSYKLCCQDCGRVESRLVESSLKFYKLETKNVKNSTNELTQLCKSGNCDDHINFYNNELVLPVTESLLF